MNSTTLMLLGREIGYFKTRGPKVWASLVPLSGVLTRIVSHITVHCFKVAHLF